MLLQLLLLRVLLLRVYAPVLWHGEAGKLEAESSPGITNPPPEKNWQAGFLFLAAKEERKTKRGSSFQAG
jgi:hypothetical protein